MSTQLGITVGLSIIVAICGMVMYLKSGDKTVRTTHVSKNNPYLTAPNPYVDPYATEEHVTTSDKKKNPIILIVTAVIIVVIILVSKYSGVLLQKYRYNNNKIHGLQQRQGSLWYNNRFNRDYIPNQTHHQHRFNRLYGGGAHNSNSCKSRGNTRGSVTVRGHKRRGSGKVECYTRRKPKY